MYNAFINLVWNVRTFQMLKRGSVQTIHMQYVFSRIAVRKLCCLSIKDALRCMPVWRARAISRSENKVKLSTLLLKHVWEVKLINDSNDHDCKLLRRQTRTWNRAKLDLITPPYHDLLNKISETFFQKCKNTWICIEHASKRVYKWDFSAIWTLKTLSKSL